MTEAVPAIVPAQGDEHLPKAGGAIPLPRWHSLSWLTGLLFLALCILSGTLPAAEKHAKAGNPQAMAAGADPGPRRGSVLLIGNQAYPWGPLETPINDIRAMREQFQRAGLHTEAGENLGQSQFYDLIDRFVREQKRSEFIVFYYAGHAIQLNGRNYLIPVDANIDDPDLLSRLFDLSYLLDTLAGAPAKMRFVILDACRSNPFSALPKASSGLSELVAPPNTLVAFSTAPGQTADDGDGRHSPYTLGLLKYLFQPLTRIEDSLKSVRRFVRLATENRQTPWENTSLENEAFLVASPLPGQNSPSAPAPRASPAPRPAGLSRDVAGGLCRQIFTKLSLGLAPLTPEETLAAGNCKQR